MGSALRGVVVNRAAVATKIPAATAGRTAARRLRLAATSDFHTNFQSYTAHYGVGYLQPVIGAYLRYFHGRSLCTFVPTQQLSSELVAKGYLETRVVARGVDTALYNPQRRSTELRARWGIGAHDPAPIDEPADQAGARRRGHEQRRGQLAHAPDATRSLGDLEQHVVLVEADALLPP